MARLLVALLTLACACAPRPYLRAPGVELFVNGPAGKKQWRLLVKFMPADAYRDATVIFDEAQPDKLPPKAAVTLTRRGFDARDLPEKVSVPTSYRLMTVTWDAPEGPRGAVFEQCDEREEIFPLLWWGLREDPGFDRRTPAENWARMRELFPAKKP